MECYTTPQKSFLEEVTSRLYQQASKFEKESLAQALTLIEFEIDLILESLANRMGEKTALSLVNANYFPVFFQAKIFLFYDWFTKNITYADVIGFTFAGIYKYIIVKLRLKNVHKNQVQTLNFKLNITLSAYQKSNERIVFAGAISN